MTQFLSSYIPSAVYKYVLRTTRYSPYKYVLRAASCPGNRILLLTIFFSTDWTYTKSNAQWRLWVMWIVGENNYFNLLNVPLSFSPSLSRDIFFSLRSRDNQTAERMIILLLSSAKDRARARTRTHACVQPSTESLVVHACLLHCYFQITSLHTHHFVTPINCVFCTIYTTKLDTHRNTHKHTRIGVVNDRPTEKKPESI